MVIMANNTCFIKWLIIPVSWKNDVRHRSLQTMDKSNIMKIYVLLYSIENKVKKPTEGEKIFANHLSDKGLISVICGIPITQ